VRVFVLALKSDPDATERRAVALLPIVQSLKNLKVHPGTGLFESRAGRRKRFTLEPAPKDAQLSQLAQVQEDLCEVLIECVQRLVNRRLLRRAFGVRSNVGGHGLGTRDALCGGEVNSPGGRLEWIPSTFNSSKQIDEALGVFET
jgi:hypothetical protein